MAKVSKSQFGSKRPKITQDDLEKDVAVLTLTEAEVIEVEDAEQEDGIRNSIVLSFDETEDRVLWPNATEIGILIDKLGDDTDKWAGRKVVVEKVVRKFKGQKFPKVGIMDGEEWEKYLPKASAKRAR